MSSDDRAVSFGAVLAQLRTARGLSQCEVARRVGLHHSHVSRLESGGRNPERDTILMLADRLGLPATERDELLTAGGYLPIDLDRWCLQRAMAFLERGWLAAQESEAA